ncbi:MAG: type VI secretion system-associated protein TagO [Pseudomonadota bacterium]
MKTAIQICAVIMLMITSPVHAQIKADKFDVKTDLNGQTLTVTLDTDLPDNTKVMFSVSRVYYEKGDSKTAYTREYTNQKMTVIDWKTPQTVILDNAVWQADLKAHQDKMVPMGLGFEVAKIEDQIEVSLTVPVNQANPAFGDQNSKLSGKVVTKTDYGLRLVEKDIKLDYPLDGKVALQEDIAPSAAKFTGEWKTQKYRSEVDDSQNVIIQLDANAPFENDLGKSVMPSLFIRCQENKTDMGVNFETFLGMDSMPVLHRIESDEAKTTQWMVTTNHLAVLAPSPIKLIREMMHKERLLVKLTPHGANSVSTHFYINGLQNAIKPVQNACGWK